MAVLVLTGCASIGSVKKVRGEIAQIREQAEELRKAQDSSARELAKTIAELKKLEGELARAAEAARATGQQVGRVEARLGETEEAVRALRGSLDGISREVVRLATPPAPPPGKPAEQPRQSRGRPAEQLYAAALANFRAREHGQAILEFTDFIARYPSHPLAGNAQFWIGEAYYLQRDYRQALVEYEKVVELKPKADKTAEALLKIGLSFRALNDPKRAQEAWQRLVREHPDSEAGRRARTLLTRTALPEPAR